MDASVTERSQMLDRTGTPTPRPYKESRNKSKENEKRMHFKMNRLHCVKIVRIKKL